MTRAEQHFQQVVEMNISDYDVPTQPVRNYYGKDAWRATSELRYNMASAVRGVKYDTMIGTGMSGTVFAARMAPVMHKDFAILRKENDNSHMGAGLEGFVGDRWLFVDEFISTGETLRRVVKFMSYHHPRSEFVGAYLYHHSKIGDAFRDVGRLLQNRDLRKPPIAPVIPITPTATPSPDGETIEYYTDASTGMRIPQRVTSFDIFPIRSDLAR